MEFPPGPGGLGSHAFQLAAGLGRLGWSVSVLTNQSYSSDGQIAEFNHSQPFRVHRLDWPWRRGERLYRYWCGFRERILRLPHVTVATGHRSAWLVADVMSPGARPWLAIGHGSEFGGANPEYRARTVRAFNKATAIACVSDFTRRQMLTAGVSNREVTVIRNGADPSEFPPLPATRVRQFRELHSGQGSFCLLTVGAVTERKGQEVVIRALPLLLAAGLDVNYWIVGVPFERPRLAALAAELGVGERTHFLGAVPREDVNLAMRACDLFVMTSTHTGGGDVEGFGIAVVEAAVCGKAAVVSGGSGLSEAVEDGVTGVVVEQGSSLATAAGIESLLRDDTRRLAMERAARARAERDQTWAQKILEYSTLLEGLATPKDRRPSKS